MIKIYQYTNLITNKPCYTGQTKDSLEKRAGNNGYHYKKNTKYFGPAIEKYSWENFKPEVLAETEDKEYAYLLEWLFTDEYKTYYPYGYNDSIGFHVSEETKQRISKAFKGRHLTEEHKKKISEAMRKKKQ